MPVRRPVLTLPLLALLSLLAWPVQAQHAEAVRFAHEAATSWGESLYVLGDLPELGGGDPRRAVRMAHVGHDRWVLTVALPAGARYRYAFVSRWNAPDLLDALWNAERRSPVLSGVVPGSAAERSVTVRYASGWSRVVLRYRRGPGRVEEVALRREGPGRGPGEWRWVGEATTSLPQLELVLHDGAGRVDRAPGGGTYASGAAELAIQDGQVFAGREPGEERRGRVVRVRDWYSQTLGNARDVFVYLPRGYDRTTRRYPVLYAHDGQNLFGPDAMFGGWRLEDALDRLIAAGRVEELIVIGVGNTAARMAEYVPPEDGGRADRYGAFLTGELKPWVDATLRTRPEREQTGVLGSSLGGLVSLYLGWERSDAFGRVGSLSGSFWLNGFLGRRVAGGGPRDLRVWLDSGTAGPTHDSYEATLFARDLLLANGHVLGGDLRHEVARGAGHNEAAWRARTGEVLEFLFPAR